MEALANFMIATVDLVEAEGRMLRYRVARLGVAAALGLVALLMVLIGVGFILFGAYWLLAERMTFPSAALVFGAVALGLAGGSLWAARKLIR